jgi:hypothetical protein
MVKLFFEGMKAYKMKEIWLFALMKITNDSTVQRSECNAGFLKLFSWMV